MHAFPGMMPYWLLCATPCGVCNSEDCSVQVLKGSRQQTAAGGKQAGIMPEEPNEDEVMPKAEAEEAEAAEAARQELEQAPGSYVASLLQQTSLEDPQGRIPGPKHALAMLLCMLVTLLAAPLTVMLHSWGILCELVARLC